MSSQEHSVGSYLVDAGLCHGLLLCTRVDNFRTFRISRVLYIVRDCVLRDLPYFGRCNEDSAHVRALLQEGDPPGLYKAKG